MSVKVCLQVSGSCEKEKTGGIFQRKRDNKEYLYHRLRNNGTKEEGLVEVKKTELPLLIIITNNDYKVIIRRSRRCSYNTKTL